MTAELHPQTHAAIEPEDAELLALERPLSLGRWATFAVMAFTAACACALALMLRLDAAYVFAPTEARALGDVLAIAPGTLPPNGHVRLRGVPMTANAVHYRRALGGGEYVAFPLAGQRDVWVQVPVDESGDRDAAFRREQFEGRLVRMGDLGGRFASVRAYLAGTMRQPVDADTWVLLADETPIGSIWAIGLVLLMVGFVLLDAWLLLRWFEPLPLDQ